MENKAISELIQLIKDNPELEVMAMVDCDVVGDDYGQYNLARFSRTEVDEYVISPYSSKMMFKSDDDVFDTLEEYLSNEEYERLPDDLDGCRPIYNGLPWKKAIFVYVKPIDE